MRFRTQSRLASLAAACAVAASLAVPASAGAAQHMAGVQGHLLWGNVSIAEMDSQLDAMKRANVAITRVDVGWASVEQEGKGELNMGYVSRLDHLVEAADARGIKLLLTLFQTPCWASKAPSSLKQDCHGDWWHRDVQNYAPRRASDYADALAMLVERYGNRVHSWEIWNEPNLDYFFRTDDPVGDYADMVRAGYRAAKRADPRPIIVAGSLSDSDFEFAERLFRQGVKGHFDAFSVHPYSADRSPLDTDVSSPRYAFRSGVPAVRDVMRRHGNERPLWLTEFGWSTCSLRGGPAWANCVDRSTQALYLKRAFRQMATWSYAPVGIWFNLKNTTSGDDDRVGNYGLMTADGSEKQAFWAFRTVARELEWGGEPPAPAPDPRPARPKRRRSVVHVARRHGYVQIRGRTSRRGLAKLLVFRQAGVSGTFARRPTYRWWFAAKRRGRFSLRLRGPAFDGGRWRIVVRPAAGAHWVTAAAVLGD